MVASALYKSIIRFCDKFVPVKCQPFWNHPAGPKTVFFWGAVSKWGMVAAGAGDMFSRTPDQISIQQASTLALTGFIWSRWSYVIVPRNWGLLACNLFLGMTQSYQAYQGYCWQKEHAEI